ncbi:MAG TPA: BatD family protein [Vicinamibacteria bacterium]
MRRLRGLIAGALLLAASPGGTGGTQSAQDRNAPFTLRSEVDAHKIGVQDQLQLTITVEGSNAPDEIPLPPLVNLDVTAGPFQSSQISIVNGRVSQSRTQSYVLQPRAAGKAEIGAIQAGGQSTAPIAVDVVAGAIRPKEPQRQDPFGRDPSGDPFEDMFGARRRGRSETLRVQMDAQPSRSRLHVGEPLVLTYWLYTQASVADLQFKEAPQYGGFWVEDLEREKVSPSGEAATLEGQSYRRFPILRKLLFPTKAGTLTIPASVFRVGIARTSFFDAGGTIERATKPVTITVDPLPDAPGFSGAVGRFKATASLDRDTVPLGEAATLRFRVEGTGNLKWVDRAPELLVSGAKVFPPQSKSDLRTTESGVSGSRSWEFVVVPETSGAIEIKPMAFSYFDAGAGKIVSSETAPLTLKVAGGTAAAGLPQAPGLSAAARATGALPLRSELDRPAGWAPGPRLLASLVGLALVVHAGLVGLGMRGGGSYGSAHAASSRSVRAALRELERVSREPMAKEQAAALVEKALDEAVGGIADADDSERARAIRALLDDVRFVRYAPQLGDYSEKVKDLAARAAEAVRRWA